MNTLKRLIFCFCIIISQSYYNIRSVSPQTLNIIGNTLLTFATGASLVSLHDYWNEKTFLQNINTQNPEIQFATLPPNLSVITVQGIDQQPFSLHTYTLASHIRTNVMQFFVPLLTISGIGLKAYALLKKHKSIKNNIEISPNINSLSNSMIEAGCILLGFHPLAHNIRKSFLSNVLRNKIANFDSVWWDGIQTPFSIQIGGKRTGKYNNAIETSHDISFYFIPNLYKQNIIATGLIAAGIGLKQYYKTTKTLTPATPQ